MAEMTYTRITIGGAITREKIEDLASVIEGEFYEKADNPTTEIETAIREKRALNFAGQVNYGNPDDTVAFCMEHNLPFVLSFEAGYEWSAGTQAWVPGGEILEQLASNDGEPAFSLADLRAKDPTTTISDLVIELDRFSSTKVPALTLNDLLAGVEPL